MTRNELRKRLAKLESVGRLAHGRVAWFLDDGSIDLEAEIARFDAEPDATPADRVIVWTIISPEAKVAA